MTASAQKRLRLALRDLAAAAGFGSMVISGALPSWAVALFAAGLALALLGWRLLADRTLPTVLVLGASALLLYAAVAADKLDLVVAACIFAGVITLSRMLATPGPTADGHVHLTSLLMLAGAAALSAEMLFAAFVIAFALLSTLSLGLQTIESSGATELAALPASRQLMAGAVVALVGSAIFFAAFPRLSWNMAARRPGFRFGGALTGFSDQVRPGGDGTIKTNPRVVARIRISPDPGARALHTYWIGRTFSSFNGREWSAPNQMGRPRATIVVRPRAQPLLQQDIELLPAFGSPTLIAIDRPVVFGHARAQLDSGAVPTLLHDDGEGHIRFAESGMGYFYQAHSTSPLEGGPQDGDFDPDLSSEKYLQLPPELDARVAALAAEVLGSERDPLQAGHRLESYLKQTYRYSLELANAQDPLGNFLFNRKAGHCEDFATALAVLLRTQGLPTRVAIGFYGGERVGDQYLLRAGDSHAWAQVLIPGRGFVSLDATPESQRAAQPSFALGWLTPLYDFLDMRWRTWIVDYSIKEQAQMASRIGDFSWKAWLPTPHVSWKAIAGVGCLALAAFCALRIRRRRSVRLHPATGLLARLERTLRRADLSSDREGLEDTTQRLHRERHPVARELSPITLRYLEARFGGRALRNGEAVHLASVLERACNKYRSSFGSGYQSAQVP